MLVKKNDELGMELGRYEGGPLYVESVVSGGAAAQCGVPINWSLVRVGQYNVFNVRTLLDALDAQKGGESIELFFGEDMTDKILAVKELEANAKNPLRKLIALTGMKKRGSMYSHKSVSSGSSDTYNAGSSSPRKMKKAKSVRSKKSSESSSTRSSPSSPLLPISFLEEDIPMAFAQNHGTYVPPIIACA